MTPDAVRAVVRALCRGALGVVLDLVVQVVIEPEGLEAVRAGAGSSNLPPGHLGAVRVRVHRDRPGHHLSPNTEMVTLRVLQGPLPASRAMVDLGRRTYPQTSTMSVGHQGLGLAVEIVAAGQILERDPPPTRLRPSSPSPVLRAQLDAPRRSPRGTWRPPGLEFALASPMAPGSGSSRKQLVVAADGLGRTLRRRHIRSPRTSLSHGVILIDR